MIRIVTRSRAGRQAGRRDCSRTYYNISYILFGTQSTGANENRTGGSVEGGRRTRAQQAARFFRLFPHPVCEN